MKKICVYFLLIVSLISCSRVSSGGFRCSPDGQVCVEIHANEPLHYGDPVVTTVTITSERDVPELYVRLYFDVDVLIEGIENWEENIDDPRISEGSAGWKIAIQANQTLNFTRTFFLPLREGYFTIIASIVEKNSFRTSNELVIAMTTQGGTVYLANTPIPRTPGLSSNSSPEEIATLLAMPTITLFPTLTPLPTKTSTPTPYIYPPPPTIPPGDWPATAYP